MYDFSHCSFYRVLKCHRHFTILTLPPSADLLLLFRYCRPNLVARAVAALYGRTPDDSAAAAAAKRFGPQSKAGVRLAPRPAGEDPYAPAADDGATTSADGAGAERAAAGAASAGGLRLSSRAPVAVTVRLTRCLHAQAEQVAEGFQPHPKLHAAWTACLLHRESKPPPPPPPLPSSSSSSAVAAATAWTEFSASVSGRGATSVAWDAQSLDRGLRLTEGFEMVYQVSMFIGTCRGRGAAFTHSYSGSTCGKHPLGLGRRCLPVS